MSHLTTTLCPWLAGQLAELERAAAGGRLGHGWIFAGPKGTGKLNLAMTFATRLLTGAAGCSALPPAAEPRALVEALDARFQPQDYHPDLHVVWPEEGKRTIGVDKVRAVIEAVSLTGYAGSSKVVVIEPAESMTVQAANALLKSLEEPTEGTQLILVSHCIGRLPATIRSRCQTLSVRRPPQRVLRDWLDIAEESGAHPLLGGESVGPVQAARRLLQGEINDYNKLDDIIASIYEGRADAPSAVEGCRGLESALVLEWVSERLRWEIRHRAARTGTNSITEATGDLTENRWESLATERLFGILDDAGRLRDQLGSGVNEQLALEVLFDSFARR